jgi:mRNA-degrading endonuclease toxin of MazEF toxin-antitoxin module
MQHEVFRNPDRRARSAYPLVVVLQADIVEADTRIVAPLTTTEIVPNPPTRALPLVSHDGRDYVVIMHSVGVLRSRQLGQPLGTITQYRDDISHALDWLLFGI